MDVSILILMLVLIVWLTLNTWAVVCLRQDIRDLLKRMQKSPRGFLD